jgi:N-acetylneuraminate lyase
MQRFRGLIAAAFTPFQNDGSLNLDRVPEQAALLVESGVTGVFVGGTTGECHSLTTYERNQLIERWTEVAASKLTVIAHVGHNSLPEACAMAAVAERSGVAAIGAMAPFFFKPNADAMLGFLRAIGAAAPATPLYYYDIPSMTGVSFPLAPMLERARMQIPTLVGVKFTNYDLMTFQECLAVGDGQLDCLYGHDELLLPALSLGAQGAIGTTYNIAAPVYARVMRAFEAGDLETARREQLAAVRMMRVLGTYGVVRTAKAISRMIGVDCGPVRPPLQDLTLPERFEVYNAVKDLDIFPRRLAEPLA